MVNKNKRMRKRQIEKSAGLPFTKVNYILFGVGLILIVVGYVALSKGPWDSFESLTLAPILLILGYCVIIPLAIIYHKRNNQEQKQENQGD